MEPIIVAPKPATNGHYRESPFVFSPAAAAQAAGAARRLRRAGYIACGIALAVAAAQYVLRGTIVMPLAMAGAALFLLFPLRFVGQLGGALKKVANAEGARSSALVCERLSRLLRFGEVTLYISIVVFITAVVMCWSLL
jgi:fatty acid desaturase